MVSTSSLSSDFSMHVSSSRSASFLTARIERTADVCIRWTFEPPLDAMVELMSSEYALYTVSRST